MGKNSHIEWTENTWNAWHGCKKVSDGCKFCYMYRDKERYGHDPTVVIKSKVNFDAPLKWTEPKLIFVCSWSDFFVEEADAWREDAWRIIKATPHHTYQILTKRPERILEHLPADWGDGYDNVWIGVSVENQDMAKKRIPLLLEVPSKVRFLSCEPLLDELDLSQFLIQGLDNFAELHWIIIGGESGNDTGKWKYRPCELDWIHKIIDQASAGDVPVFVKQLGTHLSKELGLKDRHGRNANEFPNVELNLKEFPKSYKP